MCAGLLALMAGGAIAMPAAMDRVPTDAQVVISIRQLDDALSDIERMNRMQAQPAAELQMGVAFLRGMGGLDRTGSAAAVVYLPPPPRPADEQADQDAGGAEMDMDGEGAAGDWENTAAQPDVVVVVPITSFEDLTVGATKQGDLRAIALGDQKVFAKDLGGGFAAMGISPDRVLAFDGSAGRMAGHKARAGANGSRVADTNDIAVLVDLESMRPMLREGQKQLQEQMAFAAAMAGGAQAQAGMQAFAGLAEAVIEDGAVALMGLTSDEFGIASDLGVQFVNGSDSAALFDHAGDASALMASVPAMDYYAAWSMDTRGPLVRRMGEKLSEMMKAMPEVAAQMPGQMEFDKLLTSTTGFAQVIGTSPALMATGLLSNSVMYTRTSDAKGAMTAMADMMSKSDGQSVQGMKVATQYQPEAIEIDGVKISSFSVAMSPDDEADAGMAAMQTQQIMQMMYGTNLGPKGYLAAMDGAIIQTMSRDQALIEKAVGAAKNGGGLGSAEALKAIASRLPEGRVMEAFVSVDQVANAAGPMLMMFGAVDQFEPLNALPPMGFGATTLDGGLVFRMVMPNESLAAIQKMIPQNAGGEDWDQMDDGEESPEF
jgi:hypothetical protein